jgi:hypothetical protein
MTILEAYSASTDFDVIGVSTLSTDALLFYTWIDPTDYGFVTDNVQIDGTDWIHFVAYWDTTDGAASDRFRIYINGTRATIDTDYGNPTLNYTNNFNATGTTHYIGYYTDTHTQYSDGYIAEYHFLDGLALSAENFGQTKQGVWVPKAYTGSYGNEGFYLDFSNASDLGEDQSGNNNDWTASGSPEQSTDTPTNNHPVANTIEIRDTAGLATYTDGALTVASSAATTWQGSVANMGVSSGKWYWEVLAVEATHLMVGICEDAGRDETMQDYPGVRTGDAGYYMTGTKWPGNTSYGDSYTDSDVIGFVLDLDDDMDLHCYKNNVDQGQLLGSLSGTYFPAGGVYDNTEANEFTYRFIEGDLSYDPPAGFKILNENNIRAHYANTSLLEGSKGFDIVAYEGTGVEKAISSLDFSPDLVWIKNRDTTDQHNLVDSVRGATYELNSDSTAAESTVAQGLKSFDSAGFTLGTDLEYNTNTENYVAWCWKEDPKYGFDIVSFTGTGSSHTESHDLGIAPELIIVKNRDNASMPWIVYHTYLNGGTSPEDYYIVLSTDAAEVDASADPDGPWNRTAPTSSVFSVGDYTSTNGSSADMIAYLWASIPGYSKVFNYSGNANANGPFIHCGFRPRFILIKNADIISGWVIWDTERDLYNPTLNYIVPNSNAAEVEDADGIDILSNGFKIKDASSFQNGSTNNMIGIAFAETPFEYAVGR